MKAIYINWKFTPHLISQIWPELAREIKEMREAGDKFPNIGNAIRRLKQRNRSDN